MAAGNSFKSRDVQFVSVYPVLQGSSVIQKRFRFSTFNEQKTQKKEPLNTQAMYHPCSKSDSPGDLLKGLEKMGQCNDGSK